MDIVYFQQQLMDSVYSNFLSIMIFLKILLTSDYPESDRFKHLVEKYVTYMEKTMGWIPWKTTQFWINYAYLTDMYLILPHAMKMNDTQLFAYVLFKISSIFFSTNHQNYARWMTLYSLELISLPEENPVLIEMLHKERFSVNRTGHSFSHVGVDMALEQRINAEAKSRLGGIMAYVDVASAVNRWVVTNSMRSQLVNSLLDLVDLEHATDGNKELPQSRTEKDRYDLGNIKSTENLLKKDKSKQVKEIVNVRGTRDMFSLNTVFHYPILPEPPYFAHPDGSLREGKKVSMLYLMKGSINSYIPGDIYFRSLQMVCL